MKLRKSLKKSVHELFVSNVAIYFNILFAHIKYNCKYIQFSSYSVSGKMKLFKSE